MRTSLFASLVCALAVVLTPTAPAFAGSSVDRAVVRAINAQRRHHGLRPLHLSRALDRAAQRHSNAMARSNTLTHAPSLAGRLPHPRNRAWTMGETIAWLSSGTRKLASSVVRMWMHSPPHRAILLSSSYRTIGVGAKRGGGGTYFTADLEG